MKTILKALALANVGLLAYCAARTLPPGYVRDPQEVKQEKTKYMYARQEKEYTAKRLNQALPSGPDCSKLDDKAFVECRNAEIQQRIAESRDNAPPSAPTPVKERYDVTKPREKTENEKWRACRASGRSGCGYQ